MPNSRNFIRTINKFFLRLNFRIFRVIHARPLLILATCLILTVVSAFFAAKLFQNIRTDFITLLPDGDPGVRNLQKVMSSIGGTGSLFVTVHSPQFSQNAKFVEALAGRLKKYPQSMVLSVDYNTHNVENFLKKYAAYYLKTDELAKISTAFETRLERGRLKAMDMDFEDSDPNIQFTRAIKQVISKYQVKAPDKSIYQGFFAEEEGKFVTVIIRPAGKTSDIDAARALIGAIDRDIRELNPETFFPGMEVQYSGVYATLLQNVNSVIEDTVSTAGLTLFLIFFSLYAYYRSLRITAFLGLSILFGVFWTFAITWFKIGYLNQQTAFLASIIAGNGINFGIIIAARFMEEKSRAASSTQAIKRGLILTMPATLMSAVSSAIAYGLLGATSFKGFSQFGFIGSVGMLICWLAFMISMPCLLTLSEHYFPVSLKKFDRFGQKKHFSRIAFIVSRHSQKLTLALVLLAPLTVAGAVYYVSTDRFEYNLRNISVKQSFDKGNYLYSRKLDRMIGMGSNATVIIAESRPGADRLARRMTTAIEEARKSGQPLLMNSVRWLDEFLPHDLAGKNYHLAALRGKIKPEHLAYVPGKYQKWGSVAYNALWSPPARDADLPLEIRRYFQETDGQAGRIVYVGAAPTADLFNLKELIRLKDEVYSFIGGDEPVVAVGSDAAVFIDIMKNISSDGPKVSLICIVFVGFFIALGFRNRTDFSFVFGFLLLSLAAFLSAAFLLDIKINFLNFIAIPITVGIGVDYAINIYQRYALDGKRSITGALVDTGSAVVLSSWTTIIGYGTMLVAKNQAMANFGKFAVIGEICCLFYALIAMPAVLHYLSERKQTR